MVEPREAGRARASWSCSASWVAIAHTVLGYSAFAAALVVCLALHYHRVVKNHVAGWPDEYWPSVSATIGDWFPERNLFQVLVAVTSGPRFALVGLCGLLAALQGRPKRAAFLLVVGILRTFSCGGWIFVTSSDHALLHDVTMGLYIGLTPIWMAACFVSLAPAPDSKHAEAHQIAQRVRTYAAIAFYSCTPFMVRLYLRHRRDNVKGAYTDYAMFEWLLVVFDVLFDMGSVWDLKRFTVKIAYDDTPAAKKEAPPPAPETPVWVSVVSRTYLACTAWSSMSCLISLIFYFSVSNMAAEGLELLVLAQSIGLFVVGFTPVRRWLVKGSEVEVLPPYQQAVLWLVSFATIATFCMGDDLTRLVVNAGSSALLAVISALDWATAWQAGRMDESATIWLMGFLMLVVARYWNHANSPLWPFLDASNGGQQVPGLVLALLSLVPVVRQSPTPAVVRRRPEAIPYGGVRFAIAALALGAWLCTMQTLLSDSGTVIAWGWTGYPVRGPRAVEHGVLVILAFACGTLAALYRPRLGTAPLTVVLYGVGTAVLFYCDNWLGFAGGLAVAFALPTMGLPLLQAALSHGPFAMLFSVWTIYTTLAFLGVLTVAYAFLPGAYIMREHTGAVLVLQYVLVAAGLGNARSAHVAERLAVQASTYRCAFRKAACGLVAALVVLASVVPLYRHVPARAIVPHYPEHKVLTAGIWTVHFGFDQLMRDSTRRMTSILKELKMDVIGLLETDLHRPAFANRDLTQYLAQELGMYADLGPSPKKHTWGAVLLSKFPIINSTHHLLPSPHGELAPAVSAYLDVFGTPVHVIVSHNGQEEDVLDRELQTKEIARILRESYPRPALFLGYVVTHPHARRPAPYEILFYDGGLMDVDQEDFDRWCQYLGFRAVERVGYARVSRYTVTDTELQTFKVHLPEYTVPPNRDLRPQRVPYNEPPDVPWAYPTSLIKPHGWLNAMHMYGPRLYPQYFRKVEA